MKHFLRGMILIQELPIFRWGNEKFSSCHMLIWWMLRASLDSLARKDKRAQLLLPPVSNRIPFHFHIPPVIRCLSSWQYSTLFFNCVSYLHKHSLTITLQHSYTPPNSFCFRLTLNQFLKVSHFYNTKLCNFFRKKQLKKNTQKVDLFLVTSSAVYPSQFSFLSSPSLLRKYISIISGAITVFSSAGKPRKTQEGRQRSVPRCINTYEKSKTPG